MTGGGRVGAAVAAALVCGALAVGPPATVAAVAAPSAPTAPGPGTPTASASAGASSEPTSLPGLTQRLTGDECRKASDRTVNRMPWPQAHLRPDTVWPLTEGAGVTVAVVGSGVDDSSGLLGSRLSRAPRQFDGGPAADCAGHGTFTAGLIAAARTPGSGFAGLAPRARVLDVPVTDRRGSTTPDLLAAGIRVAADGGARVIAVMAVAGSDSQALADAVRYAVSKGAVVIAPAAPDGEAGGAAFPAAHPQVLSVAATGPGGIPAKQAAGGRVDLTAPGEAVMGPGPGGKGHFTASGPSYAAALVAGTAALVLGYRPELSGEALAHRLRATASGPGGRLPDTLQGYGPVDPVAAVTAVLPEEQQGGAPGLPGRARASAPGVVMPPAPGPSAAGPAWLVTAAAFAVGLGMAGAAVVVPGGRRRGWRPGRYRAPAADGNRGSELL
ncbi:S8 family serine peptidase [Streptomyces sp. NBC_00047]|uniref:S8 family serine peptidase n=1 Tax=Streptomyces sp. NBC_00047 TaxID=2975627 RepID=UPI002255FFAF|nr:S8 family serine peptidase [Streptomyces sp. NBC_00047]MCX5610263.1 S8 family serine peptidase [Streptomyces sp. NBC_00047]